MKMIARMAAAFLLSLNLLAYVSPMAATAPEQTEPGGATVVANLTLRWCAWGTVGRCDAVTGVGLT